MRLPVALPVLLLAIACHRPTEPPAVRIKPTNEAPSEKLGTLPPGIGLAVGQPAPDVTAKDLSGQPVRLGDLTSKAPTLVVFYRGGWCPFCNFQIRELTTAAPQFAARGVSLLAVSVDRPDEAAVTRARYTLPFAVLSDSELSFVNGFQVANHVSDEEFKKLSGFGMNLEAASGKVHHVIAVPALFFIDQSGTIRWAHAERDYKTRPTPQQILTALDSAGLLPQ